MVLTQLLGLCYHWVHDHVYKFGLKSIHIYAYTQKKVKMQLLTLNGACWWQHSETFQIPHQASVFGQLLPHQVWSPTTPPTSHAVPIIWQRKYFHYDGYIGRKFYRSVAYVQQQKIIKYPAFSVEKLAWTSCLHAVNMSLQC